MTGGQDSVVSASCDSQDVLPPHRLSLASHSMVLPCCLCFQLTGILSLSTPATALEAAVSMHPESWLAKFTVAAGQTDNAVLRVQASQNKLEGELADALRQQSGLEAQLRTAEDAAAASQGEVGCFMIDIALCAAQ